MGIGPQSNDPQTFPVAAGDGGQQQPMTFVLVAKTLTKSDTGGRIILPRVAVEANLAFIVGYRSVHGWSLPI